MAGKRTYTPRDMQGNPITGLPTAAAGTSDSQAATTEFVTNAVKLGSSKSFDLVNRQASAVTLLNITADTLVTGSDWWWRASHLPLGRQVFFEISGAGSVAGLGVTASLYTAAGVLVAGSTVTATGTAATLAESSAFAMPATDTLMQVKFKNSSGALLGTGSLFIARLNIR